MSCPSEFHYVRLPDGTSTSHLRETACDCQRARIAALEAAQMIAEGEIETMRSAGVRLLDKIAALEAAVARAEDAAQKGKLARENAAAMEMQIAALEAIGKEGK